MRRLILIATAVFLTSAGTAFADTGSITVSSSVGDRATATFSATKTTCATPNYCGWFAHATIKTLAEPCEPERGHVWVGPTTDGLKTVSATEEFYSPASEGQHRLCLYVYANSVDTLLAEVVYAQDAGGTPAPQTVPPPPVTPAPIKSTLLPSSIGRRDATADRLTIFPAEAPTGVDSNRFVAMVRAVAKRWSITTGGVSQGTFRFSRPDGRDAIGFAHRPYGTLGTTNIWSARVYRPRRVCGQSRCRIVRRYIGRRIVERDTAFDLSVPWQQGPAYPTPEQYDLETTMIHELGHWAGNDHVKRCSPSPMVAALGAGDWWRDTADYRYADCGTKASAANLVGTLEATHRTIDVKLPAGLPDAVAEEYAATLWAHRGAASE